MTNLCHILTNINMQFRQSMFCDNSDDMGKVYGDNTGISLEI